MAAAKAFFRGAVSAIRKIPRQVTSDGHDFYPRALREVLGPKVEHRCSAYLNPRIEQDHRVKQRYTRCWALVRFTRPNASVEPSRKFGNTFGRGVNKINTGSAQTTICWQGTSPRVDVPGGTITTETSLSETCTKCRRPAMPPVLTLSTVGAFASRLAATFVAFDERTAEDCLERRQVA
jgi:hypothetical protein